MNTKIVYFFIHNISDEMKKQQRIEIILSIFKLNDNKMISNRNRLVS